MRGRINSHFNIKCRQIRGHFWFTNADECAVGAYWCINRSVQGAVPPNLGNAAWPGVLMTKVSPQLGVWRVPSIQ